VAAISAGPDDELAQALKWICRARGGLRREPLVEMVMATQDYLRFRVIEVLPERLHR
jgi:hypothetical protein